MAYTLNKLRLLILNAAKNIYITFIIERQHKKCLCLQAFIEVSVAKHRRNLLS